MTALLYTAVILLLLAGTIGVLVLRGKLRKRQEMQTLLAVMRQALDEEPEKPKGKDL